VVDGPSAPHVRALPRYGETAATSRAELALVPVPFDPAAVLPAATALREGHLPEAEVPLSLHPGGPTDAYAVGIREPRTLVGITAREQTPSHGSITLTDEAGVCFPEGALLLALTVGLVGWWEG